MSNDTKSEHPQQARGTTKKLKKIITDIFKNLPELAREVMPHLRHALIGQDEGALALVKRYLTKELAPAILEHYEIEEDKEIPPELHQKTQDLLAHCLCEIASDQQFSEDMQTYYTNLTKASMEFISISATRTLLREKKYITSLTIQRILPTFFSDPIRLAKFNAAWNGYLEPVDEAQKKDTWRDFELSASVVAVLAPLCLYESRRDPDSYSLSILPILGAVSILGITAFRMIDDGIKTCKYPKFSANVRAHIDKEEREKASQFTDHISDLVEAFERPTKASKKAPSHAKSSNKGLVAPLPDLKEIRSGIQSIQDQRAAPAAESKSEFAEETPKRLPGERKPKTRPEGAAETPPPPPPVATASPVVDLTAELCPEKLADLGHTAHYAGEDAEKNTLFPFVEDGITHHIFLHPNLEEEMKRNLELWEEFQSIARRGRFARDDNQPGIKPLKGNVKIKDPVTGELHKGYELKIDGNDRLVGAHVSVKKENGETYSVYVFNTFWENSHSRPVPKQFSYTLLASPGTTAQESKDAADDGGGHTRKGGRSPARNGGRSPATEGGRSPARENSTTPLRGSNAYSTTEVQARAFGARPRVVAVDAVAAVVADAPSMSADTPASIAVGASASVAASSSAVADATSASYAPAPPGGLTALQ